jgi:histidine triad (HIT) family protein
MVTNMSYDSQNIFAKILRKEIPCDTLFENEYVFAFNDISPKAPVHILIIPKGAYTSSIDFYEKASEAEITEFHRAIAKIANDKGLVATGYRLISNHGANGGQEVPHFHVHLLGGGPLGPMVSR